jgi:3,4-dihydroxyphenylacetate 2,3-dioxygenase
MRYMNSDQHFKVVSVAAWCAWHKLEDSRKFGSALKEAIEASNCTVAVLASGSLSHRFNDNASDAESMFRISREFFRQVDLRVVELWKQGDFKTFTTMLPEYAQLCQGEGLMHDTAMLLGMLGWDEYRRPVEIITPYFASSGTGQINAIFPLPGA